MVLVISSLSVVDNTKVKKVCCLRIFKNSVGGLGDKVLVSVKIFGTQVKKIRSKFTKGQLCFGIIVYSRRIFNRKDGSKICFGLNAIILTNLQGRPISNRIRGPAPIELRKHRQLKIIALATWLV